MIRSVRLSGASLAALSLAACATATAGSDSQRPTAVAASQAEAESIDALFERYDEQQLELSPLSKAYRGIRDEDYARWGDFTEAGERAEYELLQRTAEQVRTGYAPAQLDEEDALSRRLFDSMAQRRAALWPFRDYGYIFDQMRGAQSQLPAFLINIHRVSNADEARAYVERIDGLGDVIDTLRERSAEQAADGIMPPDWVYPYVIDDVENLLEADDENAILEDFGTRPPS